MSLSDPISDMLTRIRNGQMARFASVIMPHSKINEAILKVLLEEGYISSYKVEEVTDKIKNLVINLKYSANKGVIKEINRVSKPGLRKYLSVLELKARKYYNGLGIYIVSTSKGVMSDREAKKLNVSGEILCNVY